MPGRQVLAAAAGYGQLGLPCSERFVIGADPRSRMRPGILRLICRSIDLGAVGDDCVCVNYLFDLPAVLGDHEVYVERGRRSGGAGRSTGGADDDSRSSAIRIYRVGAGTVSPFLWWRVAAGDDVIDLANVTSAIVVLQCQATDRQVRVEDGAFNSESIIAEQRLVRALRVFPLRQGGCAWRQ
jgi:hypothetical protein